MRSERIPALVLGAAIVALLGHALSIRVAEHKQGGFFSDEATYHSMTWSLALDGDVRYEEHDLRRVWELGYSGGPTGIFLVRDALTHRMYFAKALAYSLAAAPFVRAFGDNGFFVLHALLFGLVVWTGYLYLRRTLEPGVAALWTLTYFLASIAVLYYFWMTPEWFNLSIAFLATFLWLYKETPPAWPEASPVDRVGWLAGGWTDAAAAVLYGVAAYSKPPSLLLAGPMLVWMAARGRWRRAAGCALLVALSCVALFAATAAATGEWNYMGGDRKSFYGPFPLQAREFTWERTGTSMVTEVTEYAERIPRLDILLPDLVYVWVGRNGGLLVYMLPAVLALAMFLAARGRRLVSPYGLLALAFIAEIGAYMIGIQGNWVGGGGTLGSRYFVNFYSVLFFLIPAGAGLLAAGVAWVVAGVFLSQVLLAPFETSFTPSLHTKAFPFRLLPAELTMLNDLPFNTNENARRVPIDLEGVHQLYFLDDGTWLREPETWGFWVKAGATAEVVLRGPRRLEAIDLRVTNGPVDNVVSARLDGRRAEASLAPGAETRLRLEAGGGFSYGDTFLYRFVVESERGFVPYFTDPGSVDVRALGVFVELQPLAAETSEGGG